MGHRHLFNTSQIFEIDHNQNQNYIHGSQSYTQLGRAGATDNGSFVYSMENLPTGGLQFAPYLNSSVRSNEYIPSALSMEVPHYRSTASGSSYDPFLHSSATGSLFMVPENYAPHAFSSSYHGHTNNGVESGIVDPMVGNGRGPYKRKSPGISAVCNRGGTSRYFDTGSSSGVSRPSDLQQQGERSTDSQHCPWGPIGITSSYRGSGLSIGGESSMRNVRSRATLDLEANLARTHLSSRHPYLTSHPTELPNQLNLNAPGPGATFMEWNHSSLLSAARERNLASDTSGSSFEMSQFRAGGSATNGSAGNGGYNHDSISSRNPAVPMQDVLHPPAQAVRVGRSGYPERAMTTHRDTLGLPHLGHGVNPSEDVLQLVPETYSSRHSRATPVSAWHSIDRNGRPRTSFDRTFSNEVDARDRLVSEALMMVDRSAFYNSRNLLDHHRDMRLDVDNMSYEELLALGERIGTVNTGLSEHLISEYLTETIHCSLDQNKDEESCVICLEEYKNQEEVGTLKNCGHYYHVGCIKKWLSMKNVCPICKAPANGDGLKQK